jgi:tRNA pseudouridine(38-40) synthase
MHSEKNPFLENSWYFPKELDIAAMNKAAEALLGTQDFTSLSKMHTDVKTNICSIYKAHWITENGQLIFEIEADRFLRNMVRAIVGTMITIGLGKISLTDFEIPFHLDFLMKLEEVLSLYGDDYEDRLENVRHRILRLKPELCMVLVGLD